MVLEAFTFENKKISLKTFNPKVFPRRLISGGLTIDYCSLKIRLLCFLLFFGNFSRGTKSTGWPQTWEKKGKLKEFEKLSESQGKLAEMSIFEEKPGKLRENVKYVA